MSTDDGHTSWHGSVLIVTRPGQKEPKLQFKPVGPVEHTTNGAGSLSSNTEVVEGLKLYSDSSKSFWRFSLHVPLSVEEMRWEYTIPDMHFISSAKKGESRTFVVPSINDSMRIMFHSCNGFSVGTDEEAWSGPALWNSVLRIHEEKPFHVMIGGGDQVRDPTRYCEEAFDNMADL